MNPWKERLFGEHDFSHVENAIVILDIDGTLCPHGFWEPDRAARSVVSTLKQRGNRIFIASNNYNRARTRLLAKSLEVEFIETPYRKPDRRVYDALPEILEARPRIVIGDKVLTDGLFALRIGARFCKVRSRRAWTDPCSVRFHYFIDFFCRLLLRPLFFWSQI